MTRIAGLMFAVLALLCAVPAASEPAYPGPPSFDVLRQNALRTFLGSNNFDGSPHAPLPDFYTEAAFDGACRPLVDVRTFSEAAFADRQFQDAGPDVRYPRETIGVSRYRAGRSKSSAYSLDIVMMVMEVTKSAGFTCHYHLGAYARREGGPQAQSLKQTTELNSDLATIFADVKAKLLAEQHSSLAPSGSILEARRAWLSANASQNSLYNSTAAHVQKIVVSNAQAIHGCCATIELRVLRADAPPIPSSLVLLGKTCSAFPDTFDAPTILCNEAFIRNLEQLILAFGAMKVDDFTSDRMMAVFHQVEAGDPSPTAGSEDAVAQRLSVALLFIAAHEAGHLQHLEFGEGGLRRVSDKADSTKLAISELCRHFDGMRQDGYHLDVFDSPLKPGWAANDVWRKFQSESAVTDAASANIFIAERYSDQFGVELLLAYLSNYHDVDLKYYPAIRKQLISVVYELSLALWYQQLSDFESTKCKAVGIDELTSCFMFSNNSYVGARDLFDDYHRSILERGADLLTTIVRERSPWYALPERDRVIFRSDAELKSMPPVDKADRMSFQADLQRTALVARLMDTPLKMAAAGCIAGLNVDTGSKIPMTGMFFEPIEVEMRHVSAADLGFQ